MAWIKALSGTSIPGIKKLYDHGTQSVTWSNPGSYTYGSEILVPATFGADKISLIGSGSQSVITGTTLPIDVTNYNVLHVRSKRVSGANDTFLVGIGLNQNAASMSMNTIISTNATETEYVLDISSLTGNYYVALYNRSFNFNIEVTEVWLTET